MLKEKQVKVLSKRSLFASLLIGALSVVSMDASAGRVAHFPLDEPLGGIAGNTVGADGTVVNDAQVAQGSPGVFGTSYKFSSTAVNNTGVGGGINLGSSASVQPANDFSVSWWFNLDTNNQFDRFLEAMTGSAATGQGYRFDTGGAGNKVRTLYRDGSGVQVNLEHTQVLNTGTWYFATARVDNSNMQLTVIPQGQAVDDTFVGTSTQSAANTIGDVAYPVFDTLVGLELPGGSSQNAINASMDDLAFYDHVLSNSEIANVYNNGAGVIAIGVPGASQMWNSTSGPRSGRWAADAGTTHSWGLNAGGASSPDQTIYGRGGDRTYSYDGDESVVLVNNSSGASQAFNQFGNTAGSASFEMVFKPNGLNNGKQVLWETGGINGSGLTLTDNTLRFSTATQSDTPNEIAITHVLADDVDFVHVVGVVDHDNNATRMYVNGTHVGSVVGVNSTWSGGNAAGLGSIQAGATGGYADSGTAGDPTQEAGRPDCLGRLWERLRV